MVKDASRHLGEALSFWGILFMINRNWGQLRSVKYQDFLLPNILPWHGLIQQSPKTISPRSQTMKREIPSGLSIPLSPSPTWPPTGLGFSEATIVLGIGLIKQLETQGREENLLLHNLQSFYHSSEAGRNGFLSLVVLVWKSLKCIPWSR